MDMKLRDVMSSEIKSLDISAQNLQVTQNKKFGPILCETLSDCEKTQPRSCDKLLAGQHTGLMFEKQTSSLAKEKPFSVIRKKQFFVSIPIR